MRLKWILSLNNSKESSNKQSYFESDYSCFVTNARKYYENTVTPPAVFYFFKNLNIIINNKVYVLWSARERSSLATRRSLSFAVVINGSIVTLTHPGLVLIHVLKDWTLTGKLTARWKSRNKRRGYSRKSLGKRSIPSPPLPLLNNEHWSVNKNSQGRVENLQCEAVSGKIHRASIEYKVRISDKCRLLF